MCCLQELADEAEVVARLPEIVLAGQENQTETQALVDYQDTSVRTTSAGLAAHNKWQAYIRNLAQVTSAARSYSTACCVIACAQLLAGSCNNDKPQSSVLAAALLPWSQTAGMQQFCSCALLVSLQPG